MWHDFLVAFALLLVIEGILPFMNPSALRRALLKLSELPDNTLRFTGLTSMILGLLLLHFVT